MNRLIYKDTIRIVNQSYDAYGDEDIATTAEVPALFLQSTGNDHSSNVDITTSDAHVYVDPTNEFVIENANRLEGMLINWNPFGSDFKDAWYKVVIVVIGMDKLLSNNIDNVHLYLKKTVGLPLED